LPKKNAALEKRRHEEDAEENALAKGPAASLKREDLEAAGAANRFADQFVDIVAEFGVVIEGGLGRCPLTAHQRALQGSFNAALPGTPKVMRDVAAPVQVIEIGHDVETTQGDPGEFVTLWRERNIRSMPSSPHLCGHLANHVVKAGGKLDEDLRMDLPSVTPQRDEDTETADDYGADLCDLQKVVWSHESAIL